jgi:hypothetical protein
LKNKAADRTLGFGVLPDASRGHAMSRFFFLCLIVIEVGFTNRPILGEERPNQDVKETIVVDPKNWTAQ